MAKYQLKSDGGVHDNETGADLPPSTANRHWVEFLKWKLDGNTPDPADRLPPPPPSKEFHYLPSNLVSFSAVRSELQRVVAKLKELGYFE